MSLNSTNLGNKPSIIMADKATVTAVNAGSKMIQAKHPDAPTPDEDWLFDPPMAIGYWWSEEDGHLPHPSDFIREGWEGPERAAVLAHLDNGEVQHQWRGPESVCRLCSEDNGSSCLTDGVYVWPEGFAHYIREHDVKPPKEFIQHVLAY